MEKLTFAVACRKFLSLPGENASDFMRELKNLTPEDKASLREDFLKIGIQIEVPAVAAPSA